MKNRQSGDLFEVVLFVEGENFRDAVVLHDDAVNYVAHTRVVLQNALFDVIEEFREVIFLVGTNLDEMNLEILYPPLAYKLAFDIANTGAIHSLGGNENIHHLGDGPERRSKLDIFELLENCQRRFYHLLFCFFRLVC
jgi:hypothetical protein